MVKIPVGRWCDFRNLGCLRTSNLYGYSSAWYDISVEGVASPLLCNIYHCQECLNPSGSNSERLIYTEENATLNAFQDHQTSQRRPIPVVLTVPAFSNSESNDLQ